MIRDPFADTDSVMAPIVRIAPVDLSTDTTFTAPYPRAIYVGGSGNIVLTPAGQTDPIPATPVTAGALLPFRPRAIASTANGTSATHILALY